VALVVVVYSVVDLVEVLLWVVPFEEVSAVPVYFAVGGTDGIAGAAALVVVVVVHNFPLIVLFLRQIYLYHREIVYISLRKPRFSY
jgi:hypothetical protein